MLGSSNKQGKTGKLEAVVRGLLGMRETPWEDSGTSQLHKIFRGLMVRTESIPESKNLALPSVKKEARMPRGHLQVLEAAYST